QYRTKRRSCPNTRLKYGLSGSAQNSSIPRGAWKAPGTMPSRSSSRTSRMSTNCTPGSPSRALASSTGIVAMRALASATSCLMPFFSAMGCPALLCVVEMSSASGSATIRDFGFDQLRQHVQRIAPAEVAHVDGDHGRDAGLLDLQVGARDALLQPDGDLHLAGQLRAVEGVGVVDQRVLDQLDELHRERVARTGAEVGERHAVAAADARLEFMHRRSKAVGRKPAHQRVGAGERAVHPLGRRGEDRSEEHTSELQSRENLVCRLLL